LLTSLVSAVKAAGAGNFVKSPLMPVTSFCSLMLVRGE
jgi:hypothetical protein